MGGQGGDGEVAGGPENTLPMMTGDGPYGPIEMGGMFTLLKVRDNITDYKDPGYYKAPKGTVAYLVDKRPVPAGAGQSGPKTLYMCPMGQVHHQAQPGECPVCAMTLVPEK